DMGVDVNGPGHYDLPGGIVTRLSTRAHWRRDDPAVAHPDVADLVAVVRRIDDPSAGDACQHAGSRALGNAAAMRLITSATEMASLGSSASTLASVPVAARYSTPA